MEKKQSLGVLTGWGTPSAPLLPAALREALAGRPVDGWIASELGVEAGATFSALDRTAWDAGVLWSPRVENYLVAVLRKTLPQVQSLRALAQPLSPQVDLAVLPLRRRTRNALTVAGYLDDRVRLSAATYGELLELRGMGYASVLDFAASAERYVEEPSVHSLEELSVMTERVLEASWSDHVTGDDPRFSDLLPRGQSAGQQLEILELAGRGSSAAYGEARARIPALEQRAAAVEEQKLEDGLRDYVTAAMPHLDDRQLGALLARMGWLGPRPVTLEVAGKLMGTTRERVRQLQSKLAKRRSALPLFMPTLDRALDEISLAAPISAADAALLLQQRGISVGPFHPASVLSAAEFCGKTPTFELDELDGTEMVISSRDLKIAKSLTHIALRQAGRYGVSNLEEVLAQADAAGVDATKIELGVFLRSSKRFEFLDDEWFWSPAIPNERNRLHNTTRGILSVVSPMEITILREGIRRRYAWRRLQLVPPRSVLLKFYDAHPDFIVEGNYVRPSLPLDYRKELGPSEQAMVDVLRTAPAGVLDRASLMVACTARGINPNTCSVLTTYSSIIAHPETDAWAIRGVDVSPMALKALLDANARRPRQRRLLSYGWTPDGELWIAYRLPATSSVVIGIPRPIAQYVAGRHFEAVAEDGTPTGTINVDANTTSSWGYIPFLSRRGADEGDVLRITFDLSAGRARLSLESSDALDDDLDEAVV